MNTINKKFAATIMVLGAIAAFSYIKCDGHKKSENDAFHGQKPAIVQPLKDAESMEKETEHINLSKSYSAAAAAILTPEEEAADNILKKPTLENCLDLAVASRKFVKPGSKRFAGALEKTAQDAKDKLAECKRVYSDENNAAKEMLLKSYISQKSISGIYGIFKDFRNQTKVDMCMPFGSVLDSKVLQELVERSKGETGGDLQLFFLNKLVSKFNEEYKIVYADKIYGERLRRVGYAESEIRKDRQERLKDRAFQKRLKNFQREEQEKRKYFSGEIKDIADRNITGGLILPIIGSDNKEDIFFYMDLAVEHKMPDIAEKVIGLYKNKTLDMIGRPEEYKRAGEILKKAEDIVYQNHSPCDKGMDMMRMNTHEGYLRAYALFMQGTCYEDAFEAARRMDDTKKQRDAIVSALKDGNRGTLTFLCTKLDSEAPVKIKTGHGPYNPPQ